MRFVWFARTLAALAEAPETRLIMAHYSRRQRRLGIDIWPGFVDALAQLVMIIVFVLMIFTAGQF